MILVEWTLIREADILNKPFNTMLSFEDTHSIRENGLIKSFVSDEYEQEQTRMLKHLPLHNISTSNYLYEVEPYIPDFISSENFKEIISIARHFPGNLTSFLGFECRLGESDKRADWAFAISGIGRDRQVLSKLLKNGYLPDHFFQRGEWHHIRNFAAAWADPNSILKEKIQCFWLEFDMPDALSEIPIPGVFFGPAKLPQDASNNDISQYEWLITTALPLLKGERLSKSIESRLKKCIKLMPENATLFQVGALLSRSANGVRLCVNRMQVTQILPYLKAIGWFDETGEFTSLIAELEGKADRFVLSFDVTDEGIGSRLGIELSFNSNQFQQEIRWRHLFDYLVEKGLCLPEKRDALLSYPGTAEKEEYFSGGILKPLTSVSRNLDEIQSSTIVRYINHVKIVYQPGRTLEAKAYPAVRLFEFQQEHTNE